MLNSPIASPYPRLLYYRKCKYLEIGDKRYALAPLHSKHADIRRNTNGTKMDTNSPDDRAPTTERTPEMRDTDETPHPATTNAYAALAYEDQKTLLIQTLALLHERDREMQEKTALMEACVRNLSINVNPVAGSTPLEKTAKQPSRLRTRVTSLSSPLRQCLANDQPAPVTADSSIPATTPIHADFPRSMPPYPNAMIREALELVPRYDGHNLPAWRFAKACKRVRESLPLLNESYLVTLIRNKLLNHAYLIVEDECHVTLDGLLDSLKRVFGSGKGPNYYRGQLSITFMKPGEHVLDYIGRVKDLRNNIVEGDQELVNRTLNATETDAIDGFVFESFFEGLPPQYRCEFRPEDCCDLPELYAQAIAISKRIERDNIRYKNPPLVPQPRILTRTNDPANARPPNDHNRDYNNNNNNNYAPVPQNSQNHLQQRQNYNKPFPTKVCNYCKGLGHLISECRKRLFNNNLHANRDIPSSQTRVNRIEMSHARGNTNENDRSGNSRQGVTDGARHDPLPSTTRLETELQEMRPCTSSEKFQPRSPQLN